MAAKVFGPVVLWITTLPGWLLPPSAHAQSPTDSVLSGQVLRPDGTPAAFAHLELERLADQPCIALRRSTALQVNGTADKAGHFFLLRLEPGAYTVHAADTAFTQAGAAASVSLAAGEEENIILKLGSTTTVPCPGSPALPASPVSSAAVNADRIAELPIEAGEWEGLQRSQSLANDATTVSDASNVERDGSADSAEASRRGGQQGGAVAASSGLSYAGLPTTQNAETIDGLSAEQGFRSGPRGSAAGGPVSGTSFSQGAVRSFRVLPRTFSAQYGNAAGSVLTVASGAGTAQVHGGGFAIVRGSAFAATNPFSLVTHYANGIVSSALVKPQDTLTQFGAHLGFPLTARRQAQSTHSRPTLFASLEEQVRTNPAISTPAEASFYVLSPTQTALMRNRGVTAVAQNTALNYLDSLSGAVDRSSSRSVAFVRADIPLAEHDRLAVSYALTRFNAPAGTGFDQRSDAVVSRGRGSLGDRTTAVDAAAARWLHVFSPRLNHELRFGWTHDDESEQPRVPLPQEPAISPGGLAPQVAIEPDGFTYGTPAGLGRRAFPDEQRIEFANLLQSARGRHLISVGGDWSRVHDRIDQLNNAEGSFLYDSGTTNGRAGGLVDWITDYTFNANAYPNGGCPSINATVHLFCFRSFTQGFGGEHTEFVTHNFAGFAEDSFRLRPGFSISLGVRYEYTLLPLPQNPNAAIDAAFANIAGSVHGATASFPEDRNNLGPRLAVLWAPAGGRFGTLHIGYGAFFGRLTGATTRAALTNTALPSSTAQIRITPSTTTACPQVANQGFGYPCAYVTTPPAAALQTGSAMLFASSFRLPAVQRGSFLLERNAGRHLTLRAEYAASIATQLPGSLDLNVAPATASQTFVLQGGDGYAGLHSGQTFTLPLYSARRVSQYGPVTALVSNANSTYHAGTLEAQVRGLHSLDLRGSFTFSRAIDYGPQLSAIPRTDGQLDPFSNGYDKGLSSLHFPVRFAGQAVYLSELHRGPDTLRRAIGGWRVVAVAFAGSGAPYSYAIFGGTRLSGGRESLNGSGGTNYLPTVGRNTLRLPARASLDLRLGREFAAGSRLRVNAFAEAFNVLNGRNVARVETRAFLPGTPAAAAGALTLLVFQDAAAIAAEGLTTRPFGTATSSTTGLSRERQAEFGVRLAF